MAFDMEGYTRLLAAAKSGATPYWRWGKKRRKKGDKSKNGKEVVVVVMYTLERGEDACGTRTGSDRMNEGISNCR